MIGSPRRYQRFDQLKVSDQSVPRPMRVNLPNHEALDNGCHSPPLPTTPTLFFLSHSPSSPWIPIESPRCHHSTAVTGPLRTLSTETTSPQPHRLTQEPAATLPLLFSILRVPERSQGVLQYPLERMALGTIGCRTSMLGVRNPSKAG